MRLIYRFLHATIATFLFLACNTTTQKEETTEMKIADPHSFAQPDIAVITHLDWVASLDFAHEKIRAVATYNFNRSENANEIIFDVNGPVIVSVKDQNDNELDFTIGAEQAFLGSPLSVKIGTEVSEVRIEYETSENAAALQWLTPKQTTGGAQPFLFTQSEAILCRSWIPIQDSPGIRFTYSAHVTAPKDMLALMSASNPQEKNETGVYHFEMKQPIPAYLMALAAGDIGYAAISNRTGVYAEPAMLKAAKWEFEEMETMVQSAEHLYGKYAWDVYDLIVLPPSFPYGGMENPRLTFATPTVIAGDRSLTSLVAHELAHSWSGNLVTNATWNDFWLNEGFTVYFEQRIMEEVYGREYSEMLAKLNLEDLKSTVEDLTAKGKEKDTHLKLSLAGRDPDEGMTDIAYNKGYFFLRLLEETVGREKFDQFLKTYFTNNAFKSMTTEKFVEYLNKNLFEANGIAKIDGLYEQWIYGPGIPANCPQPESDRFEQVEKVVEAWVSGEPIGTLISQEELLTKQWSSHEWIHFIRNLPESMTIDQMKSLDDYLKFTYSGNSEILTAWMIHVIRNHYEPGYENLENFLVSVGRRKFLMPLYTELTKTDDGMMMARQIYTKARDNYHYVSVNSIDALLGWQEKVN